jgi:uncharacterized protein
LRRIPHDGCARIPWKNGGGFSVVIAGERRPDATEGDWAGVIWQLSRTDILTPAPFSDLSGFERLQTVVTGEGLVLDSPSGAIDLSRPLTVARYDGGLPIVSRLTRGAVGVINLIARKGQARIDMLPLRAGDATALGSGTHVVHAPTERASLKLDGGIVQLAGGDSFALDGPARLACLSGLALACTIQRISAS